MGHKLKGSNNNLKSTGNFIKEFITALPELFDVLGNVSYKGVRFRSYNYHPYKYDDSFYKGLKNLEHRGIIEKMENNRFRFTPLGLKWLSRNHIRYFHYRYPKWDKKWRVIIFDIPKGLHSARNRLRLKLKQLGCIMIQKSVFVFPYPCYQEFDDICKSLNLSAFVDIIETQSLGSREKILRQQFHL